MSNTIKKSSREEIRQRFDGDVERFSNLETGQLTVIDAALCLELISDAAKRINPEAQSILDIGCGGGNFTLKILSVLPGLDSTLVDLSMPMLNRAFERVKEASGKEPKILQADILGTELPAEEYDIVLAGAVLHHLREDADWEQVFKNIYQSLKPGGSFWISDLITHDHPAVEHMFKDRYGDYLEGLGGEEYRKKVQDYVEWEDTPRSVYFQLDLMKKCGFSGVEILHKNSSFAAFGGIK